MIRLFGNYFAPWFAFVFIACFSGVLPWQIFSPVVHAATGVFYDSAVEGLRYSTRTHSGITNSRGEFQYRPGETVTFFVGDLRLGSVSIEEEANRVTPADLVPEVGGDVTKIKNRKVTNMARFLQSLDRDADVENGITITANAAAAVTRHARQINFDESEAAFTADPAIVALFGELHATLRTAAQARNHLRRGMLGIQKMTDVRVPTRDGSYLLADVFRPIDEGSHPVVMTATAYGKAFVGGCICSPGSLLQKEDAEDAYFEYVPGPTTPPRLQYEVVVTPNSVDWVPHGYVIMRVDGRGSCNTPGTLYPYSAQEAFDNYDAIEWAARQRWSNGSVGLWGQSFSASIQFNVASLQPPHLKAMMPTSNDADQYRDIVFQGGLYYRDYRESWFYPSVAARALRCLDQPFVDIVNIFRANPFADPRVYGPIT